MIDYIKQSKIREKRKFPRPNTSSANVFQEQLSAASRHLSNGDPVLKRIISLVGPCGLKPHKRYFQTLVDAIVSQQLSIKVAETIFNRFKLLFKENGKFPPPELIIAMDDSKLRACGLSNAKVKYVKDLSSKVIDGSIKIHKLGRLPDEEIINELVQVKGIGVWTAQMFLIFCLARLDVLPSGDFGFKNAVFRNYKLKKFPSEKKINEISKKFSWQPYRSVAAWYHWQSLKLT